MPRVQCLRRRRQHGTHNFNARRHQLFEALAAISWMRISHGIDHGFDPRLYQAVSTGRCAANKTTRLQRHIGGRITGRGARNLKRVGFRVPMTGLQMKSAGDNLPSLDQHTTDPRIRLSRIEAAFSLTQGLCHKSLVVHALLTRRALSCLHPGVRSLLEIH